MGVRGPSPRERGTRLIEECFWSLAQSLSVEDLRRWVEGSPSIVDRVHEGDSLLTAFCRAGRVDCVRFLLDAGSDPSAILEGGASPLGGAVDLFEENPGASEAIARLLIGAGAEMNPDHVYSPFIEAVDCRPPRNVFRSVRLKR